VRPVPVGGYHDDWATCARTHAHFNIYAEALDPVLVSRRLALSPSSAHRAGDRHARRIYRGGHWSLSSEAAVESRDLRRHLDWILGQIEPHAAALVELRAEGNDLGVGCFWLSGSGHGGPQLDPMQLSRLGLLGLPVTFDFYDADGDP
jgi:hypothetical protein